jgi:hypothetical protein
MEMIKHFFQIIKAFNSSLGVLAVFVSSGSRLEKALWPLLYLCKSFYAYNLRISLNSRNLYIESYCVLKENFRTSLADMQKQKSEAHVK